MNPSSKPNKSSTIQAAEAAQTDPARQAASKAKPGKTAKAAKASKAAKSTRASEATRAAKQPAPTKSKAKTADKKPKLVHDSYSLPKDENAALGALKRRVVALGLPVKKNNLLRAGLLTLGTLGDAALLEALRALPEPTRTASTAAPQPAKTKAVKTKAPKPVKADNTDKVGKTKKAAKLAASKPQADATQAP
jgi:hypothetical protein